MKSNKIIAIEKKINNAAEKIEYHKKELTRLKKELISLEKEKSACEMADFVDFMKREGLSPASAKELIQHFSERSADNETENSNNRSTDN